MKVLAVLLALAGTCLYVQAQNVVCGKGTSSKTVTLEDGESYSFKTHKGKKYKGNTECTVDYKMGDTCAEMSFACTKFNTNNKDKKKCKKGDMVTITANGKAKAYCKTKKPKVTSSGDMQVVFSSDAKKHSSGAVCKVKCTEAASTTATTTEAEGGGGAGSQSLSQRYLDPVVITGAEVPSLLGCADCVDNLVAFSWTDGAWSQAPVQVDERHIQDYYNIKNGDCLLSDRNMTGLVYADPGTYSGADDDDTLDMDDEIVFMARFLGEKSEGMSSPVGVVEGMMEELEVLDPVTDTSLGFMYLFLSDGSLDQAAGNPLVEYVFNLTTTDESGSNAYFDVYHNEQISQDAESKNPENSYFKSKNYQRHFAENWNSDNLKIFSGESTGESLGAHQEFQFFQDSCGRCIYSFLRGATGFIVNKAGPVRAIRSWVGANSGTFTQRDSVMYEQREDVTTYLRVHTIRGIMDYISYKEDLPLIYYNCHNEEGIEVDGSPDNDSFNNKFCHWEFVTGRAGSLLRTYQIDTDLVPAGNPDAALEAWFYDNKTPDRVEEGVAIYPNNFHQCSTKLTSQKAAWGTHGMKLKSNIDHIPNTDPNRINPIDDETYPEGCSRPNRESSLNHLTITNNIYYLNPGLEIKDAKKIYQGAATPLIIRTNNFEK